jgi:squalene-hopene/tetraprenyl-beta-curcumene cyclase
MPIARLAYLLLLLPLLAPHWTAAQPTMDRALAIQCLQHTDYGLRYLRLQQSEDGSWGGSVALTALAIHAFLRSYQGYGEADGAFITRPVRYLLGHARPDGAITAAGGADAVRETALALRALKATGNPQHAPVVDRAMAYLVAAQADEADGIAPDDPAYGGIGAGPGSADLVTHFHAAEALHEAGLDPAHPLWERAARFSGRQLDAGPGEHREASADYAILGTLLYAGADRTDPRMRAAWDRIAAGHDPAALAVVEAVEPFLTQGLFAAAMAAYGENLITAPDGTTHPWREDVATALLQHYRPDGSWGDEGADRLLPTARAVGVLNRVAHSLR